MPQGERTSEATCPPFITAHDARWWEQPQVRRPLREANGPPLISTQRRPFVVELAGGYSRRLKNRNATLDPSGGILRSMRLQDRSTRCLIETGSQLRGRLRRGPLSGRKTPNIFRTAQVKPNSAESKNPPSSIAQVGTALEREEANIRVTMPTVPGVRGINLVCAVLATSDHNRIFHPFETGSAGR